jgi:hypothetical protein
VRHRARPSFTVEVKRNNKRVPLTVTTADSSPSERHRLADQLLFGGRSPAASPAAYPDDGGLLTWDPEPQRPAAEAVTSETYAEISHAQRLTGRILPDLSGETRAEVRLRQDEEEETARLWSQRAARKTSPSFEPMWTDPQAADESDSVPKSVLDPPPAAEPLILEGPVLAEREVVEPAAIVEPVTIVSLSPSDRSLGQTGNPRGRRERKGFQAGRHGAERQGTSAVLRAGEKWKRRLPRVCW